MKALPIDDILPQLKEAVATHNAVVIQAPPGAGKTTRVPLALLDILPLDSGKIIMLEPRRIAAVSAARWMAQTLNEEAGQTVGYSIRFDSRVSPATRIEVVTEGILTRRIQTDQALEDIAMVIFDEFHERSLHADLALALCLDVQRNLRNDLKILVMSATLDCGPVSQLLGNAPVITSEGKAFPVDVRWRENIRHEHLPAQMVRAVKTAVQETEGDILAFLPGAGEIRVCAGLLEEENAVKGISIAPLYGDLPFEAQERAIMSGTKRKIVLATNIAETSLTIEGVRTVIDGGLTRRLQHDPATGMNRLVTVRASKASAEQRKGRAGRVAPGVCYRLYSRHTFDAMTAFNPPEILISDLSSLILELALWGAKEPAALSWLDAPPQASISSARRLLIELGALDISGSITSPGRETARLPLHPRMARLLLRAVESGCPRLGCDLAALLSERDVFRQSARAWTPAVGESDVMDRIETLNAFRGGKFTDSAADAGAIRAVLRTADQLRRITKNGDTHEHFNDYMVQSLLLAAYPDRVAKQREPGSDRYLLSNGRGVRLSPKSSVRNRPFIIAVNVDAGDAGEGIIHLASATTKDIIRRESGSRIEKQKIITWSEREGRVAAALEERFGALLLSSRPFVPADADTAPIVCEAVRGSNLSLLHFSGNVRQLQGRLRLLRRIFPDEGWPDISGEYLKDTLGQWLAPFLSGIRSTQDLEALDILPALKALMTWEQQKRLDELAPMHLTVPSGNRAALDYAAGDAPVLAVKLQEMFGLADTPAIAGGRVKALLHLLSPARRPIQVTQDLKSFWNTSYPQVKKELKGRYPKHPWPDDPWNAAPTRGVKRKKH